VSGARSIAVVTGTRADFGLLCPVMSAIEAHPDLRLITCVTGCHLLPPSRTIDEVAEAFTITHTVEMQRPGQARRIADAAALGRGISGLAEVFDHDRPDVVLVLGDRIEAFAAAATASVAGIRVAHLHGGDRGEGIADESLRHAITKLAHIHLPATARSTERIIAMGEEPLRTHLVGSPAIDGIREIAPLDDGQYEALGRPDIVFLLHPTGKPDATERERAELLLKISRRYGRLLALHPNFDAGRDGILGAILDADDLRHVAHLRRIQFIGLLRRVRMIVGNSSAGLIEGAAIPVRCVNVGSRQAGREKPPNVINCPRWERSLIEAALRRAAQEPVLSFQHPYGNGRTGERTAELLATFDSDKHPLSKQNTY
jgi:UDP-hydrolysing UDP-N-acetyl-D-glucosamine 2-epimerase